MKKQETYGGLQWKQSGKFLRNLYGKNITIKKDIFAAHDLNVKLKEIGVKYKSTYSNNDFPNYEKGIKDLITKTSEYFKDAKIFVVQQQIPGCHFKNESTVFGPQKPKAAKDEQQKQNVIQRSKFFGKIKVRAR